MNKKLWISGIIAWVMIVIPLSLIVGFMVDAWLGIVTFLILSVADIVDMLFILGIIDYAKR